MQLFEQNSRHHMSLVLFSSDLISVPAPDCPLGLITIVSSVISDLKDRVHSISYPGLLRIQGLFHQFQLGPAQRPFKLGTCRGEIAEAVMPTSKQNRRNGSWHAVFSFHEATQRPAIKPPKHIPFPRNHVRIRV